MYLKELIKSGSTLLVGSNTSSKCVEIESNDIPIIPVK